MVKKNIFSVSVCSCGTHQLWWHHGTTTTKYSRMCFSIKHRKRYFPSVLNAMHVFWWTQTQSEMILSESDIQMLGCHNQSIYKLDIAYHYSMFNVQMWGGSLDSWAIYYFDLLALLHRKGDIHFEHVYSMQVHSVSVYVTYTYKQISIIGGIHNELTLLPEMISG